MHLIDAKDNNREYIFVAHIFYSDIDKELKNIEDKIAETGLTPTEIIFSPNENSKYDSKWRDKILNITPQIIDRKDFSRAAVSLVTNKGSMIFHNYEENGKLNDRRDGKAWSYRTDKREHLSSQEKILQEFPHIDWIQIKGLREKLDQVSISPDASTAVIVTILNRLIN